MLPASDSPTESISSSTEQPTEEKKLDAVNETTAQSGLDSSFKSLEEISKEPKEILAHFRSFLTSSEITQLTPHTQRLIRKEIKTLFQLISASLTAASEKPLVESSDQDSASEELEIENDSEEEESLEKIISNDHSTSDFPSQGIARFIHSFNLEIKKTYNTIIPYVKARHAKNPIDERMQKIYSLIMSHKKDSFLQSTCTDQNARTILGTLLGAILGTAIDNASPGLIIAGAALGAVCGSQMRKIKKDSYHNYLAGFFPKSPALKELNQSIHSVLAQRKQR